MLHVTTVFSFRMFPDFISDLNSKITFEAITIPKETAFAIIKEYRSNNLPVSIQYKSLKKLLTLPRLLGNELSLLSKLIIVQQQSIRKGDEMIVINLNEKENGEVDYQFIFVKIQEIKNGKKITQDF